MVLLTCLNLIEEQWLFALVAWYGEEAIKSITSTFIQPAAHTCGNCLKKVLGHRPYPILHYHLAQWWTSIISEILARFWTRSSGSRVFHGSRVGVNSFLSIPNSIPIPFYQFLSQFQFLWFWEKSIPIQFQFLKSQFLINFTQQWDFWYT